MTDIVLGLEIEQQTRYCHSLFLSLLLYKRHLTRSEIARNTACRPLLCIPASIADIANRSQHTFLLKHISVSNMEVFEAPSTKDRGPREDEILCPPWTKVAQTLPSSAFQLSISQYPPPESPSLWFLCSQKGFSPRSETAEPRKRTMGQGLLLPLSLLCREGRFDKPPKDWLPQAAPPKGLLPSCLQGGWPVL